MKRFNALLLLILAAAVIGCDTNTPPAPAHRGDATAVRARIAAEAAAMQAEADRISALARQSLAARKSAPRALRLSGTIEVPGDFDTIQEAVDAAVPGDVIRVRGTFTDVGVINIFTEDITLDGGREDDDDDDGDDFAAAKAADDDDDGDDDDDDDDSAYLVGAPGARFQIFADDVRITGFTLKQMRIWAFEADRVEITGNNVSDTGSGLAVLDGSRDCVVKNNHSHNNGHGLFLRDIQGCLIENNTFRNNTNVGIILTRDVHNNTFLDNKITGNWRGLRVFESNGNVIHDCKVNRNDVAGIVLLEAYNNEITECQANTNGSDGILLIDSDTNTIHESQANRNEGIGIHLRDSDNNTVEDSKARRNTECDAVDGGTGNVFSGNKFGSFNC